MNYTKSVIRKLLFLLIIVLVISGCAGKRKEINRIWPFEPTVETEQKNKWFGYSNQERKDSHVPETAELGYFNIIIILLICLVMVSVGIAIRSSFASNEQDLSLPSLSIEPFFMPKDGRKCIKRLYQDMKDAKEKICIASYWITHINIIIALKIARKRNVLVEVLVDTSTPDVTTLQQELLYSDIKFTIGASRMHHKFIIIDSIITWVGSANLTETAFSKNYESMMRIQSSEVAQRYLVDFKNLIKELG